MTGKSSLFRGVTLFRPTQKWRAQVLPHGLLLRPDRCPCGCWVRQVAALPMGCPTAAMALQIDLRTLHFGCCVASEAPGGLCIGQLLAFWVHNLLLAIPGKYASLGLTRGSDASTMTIDACVM